MKLAMAIVVACLAWSTAASARIVRFPVAGGGTLTADHTTGRFQCSPGRLGVVNVNRYTSFSYSLDTVTFPGLLVEFYDTQDPNCMTDPLYTIDLQSGCEIELDQTLRPRLVCNGIPGYIGPKYIVVGVSYAPPGPTSFVQYATSRSFGTTTSLADTFSSSTSIEVSMNHGFNIGGFVKGKYTATGSTTATQSRTDSSSATLSVQNLFTTRLAGTPNPFSPVNHDYDIVWIWLNPVMLFTVTPAPPGFPSAVTWNGYGYDMADQPAMDIWPIEVGYLNGHFGPLPFQDASVLARTWASNQQYPPGMGPGLNADDFADILRSDPFANPAYVVRPDLSTSPVTTMDGRFTIAGVANGSAQNFVYRQPAPGGVPLTQSMMNTYADTSTVSRSTSYQTQIKFGVSFELEIRNFLTCFKKTLKIEETLSFMHQRGTSVTATSSQINSLSVTGPPCNSNTPPCSPVYTGPSQFDVYQDNVFGTFMFHPVR
jgi:hypothetical protein